jgi:hypothetical protein
MPKVTIFSLDYDGCGDILFAEQVEQRGRILREEVLTIQKKLNNFLNEKANQGDQVELYIGSARQSEELDIKGDHTNKNGLCYKNYDLLCKTKKWTFRRLLLFKDIIPSYESITPSDLEHIRRDRPKIPIIKYQLLEIAKKHPKSTVDFYFIDDDSNNSIFEYLINHLKKNKKELPINVRLHLVRFDWMRELYDYENALELICVLEHTNKNRAKLQAHSQLPMLRDAKYSPFEYKEEFSYPFMEAAESNSLNDVDGVDDDSDESDECDDEFVKYIKPDELIQSYESDHAHRARKNCCDVISKSIIKAIMTVGFYSQALHRLSSSKKSSSRSPSQELTPSSPSKKLSPSESSQALTPSSPSKKLSHSELSQALTSSSLSKELSPSESSQALTPSSPLKKLSASESSQAFTFLSPSKELRHSHLSKEEDEENSVPKRRKIHG